MGRRLIALAAADINLEVVAAIESAGSPLQGQDAGLIAGVQELNVPITSELVQAPDVVIDFSVPEASLPMIAQCAERRIPILVATTGWTEEQKEQILSYAQTTALILAANTSIGVNLAMKLTQQASKALTAVSEGVDVEIIERHHRFKEDSPSGTALKFGEIVAEELGQTDHVHGREGRIGPRPQQEIGYHALRTGDNVGEHTIVFGLMGETLEVYVRGHTRDSYASGALTAAKYLTGKQPGLYTMFDVLGL